MGLMDGGIVVKWMLDWDVCWEEDGVMLGMRCKEDAWECSGARRWDGEPNTAGTWIQGSRFWTGPLVSMG